MNSNKNKSAEEYHGLDWENKRHQLDTESIIYKG